MFEKCCEHKEKHQRIHVLDELRGFAVFCMIFYHAFYTMDTFFGLDLGLKLFVFFTPLEPFFAGLFILISGFCCQLSSSNLRRGLQLLLIALLVSIITILLVPRQAIVFGILHMLACSMIIFSFFEKTLRKISIWVGVITCVLLYTLTFSIPNGHIGISNILSVDLPSNLYEHNFLFPLGIFNSKFYSSDYFPLLPWFFIFLLGTFLGRFAKEECPKWMYKQRIPFFSYMGRHALVIYIVHQPIIFAVFWLISWLFI